MINQLSDSEKKWFAINTKFKCEKYVVDILSKAGIESYVPLIETIKKYSSKVKKYKIPLINCYAFVKISRREYIKVLETQYVLKFIKVGQDLISIPEHEILLLKKIVGEFKDKMQLGEGSFEMGQEVEVIAGQLTGLKGILVESNNKSDFIVELKHIGIQLQIKIGASLLKPVF